MVKLAIQQLKNAAQQFRAWARENPWPVFLMAAGSIVFLWVLIQTIRHDNMGFREQSFWEWMELLLVPAALALAGLWFSRVQKQTELDIASQERDVDREVARDRRHQATLEAYFDRMTDLLLEKNLGRSERNQEGDDPEGRKQSDLAASIARARTLAVLRTLDPARVSTVFRFTLETKVGEKSLAEIVPLAGGNLRGVKWSGPGVDLSGAILSRADLSRADLDWTFLFEADLSWADLSWADLSGAVLSWAKLSEAILGGADLTDANLSGADLRQAILSWTNLSGADLSWANLSGAHLTDADLSGADLEGATVTTDQLLQAQTLEGATMPDGTKYEEWIKRQQTEEAESHEQDD